jgi:predicted DCC family thiol-disulfide oxidoreductase YuxK
MKIELYYDKECPFCNYYSNYIKLKENHNLILINARDDNESIKEFRKHGFDINNGFIIRVDDTKLYQGCDAIIFLNKISDKKIYFKDNYFFRNFVYPLAKKLRHIILFCLGKKTEILQD